MNCPNLKYKIMNGLTFHIFVRLLEDGHFIEGNFNINAFN
jgi:hypothetical protein